jgi:hypothetical protein
MGEASRNLLKDALDLPDEERLDLAAALLASLPPPGPRQSRTDSEWIVEIERRAHAALEGAPGIPWQQARSDIEARLARK